ncbi:hypothetical protein MNC86_23175 [Pantoea agglomerans]|uniref:hypothetical protein n=1 Tax=Enterobacter agglomerans TaxID=549 RepID=UPI001F4DABF0|nr:hypothetical protein [Pantoea agglomerans]MCH9408877.1 hypothetical protein [Pantoea agglomerans]
MKTVNVTEAKAQAESQPQKRGRLVVIASNNTIAGRAVHFVQHPLLSGCNHNLWIPVSADETWFVALERILVANGIAENVTGITPLRECAEFTDFEIIFNHKVI